MLHRQFHLNVEEPALNLIGQESVFRHFDLRSVGKNKCQSLFTAESVSVVRQSLPREDAGLVHTILDSRNSRCIQL